MKKLLLLSYFLFLISYLSFSQNVGIGTIEPVNKLQVMGNILVNAPTIGSVKVPTPAQTQTMSNGTTINFPVTDSVGRVYDPGGPGSNYINNLNARVSLPQSGPGPGFEITLEDVQLLSGDSLVITDAYNASIRYLAIGNGYSTISKFVVNAYALYITFTSNSDGVNGRGFNLLFRRLYDNTATEQPVSGAIGNSFFFDTKNGALRAGRLASGVIGYNSTALGFANKATGEYSFASGHSATASGDLSTSIGISTTASGHRSFAIGSSNTAGGEAAVAMGANTTASGGASFAMGVNGIASGESSTALNETTRASGRASTSMGENTEAIGRASVAMGNTTNAGGINAVTMGNTTTASGANAVAMGEYTSAGGLNSTATGKYSSAGGINSTAMGYGTNASGEYSTAMGMSTQAIGNRSTAIGNFTIASGAYSTAMGNYVSTSYYNGAFAIGDNSTSAVMESFVDNGFRARFAGGYRLLTNPAATIGVVLLASGNSWSAISDEHCKENFLPVDGEAFLKNISTMHLTTWNYKGQDVKTLRHYGPMAQDFYKAFGRDELGEIGCDTLINQQDFLGVSLIAIQALEKRTAQLQQQLDKAMNMLESYQQQIAMMKEENERVVRKLKESN